MVHFDGPEQLCVMVFIWSQALILSGGGSEGSTRPCASAQPAGAASGPESVAFLWRLTKAPQVLRGAGVGQQSCVPYARRSCCLARARPYTTCTTLLSCGLVSCLARLRAFSFPGARIEAAIQGCGGAGRSIIF
ncbi:hypothetical protein BX661DRAFT_68641 [Kickxella alabastrina]|uniref:uncharacterized protein n=1 Tax=Kickxella alabastrina TaxID=61397 RepID=UPI002220B77F|nr:uncharacterized protein BX661DRAFT_68641 [Kickxella alabastrina]KAI7821111.1 hypothetical protein BX661DRAFT_68641 [Kickxella alabastrina]